MMAYADQTDHLSLPSAWYNVDFGLARSVVIDTNRHVRKWDPQALTDAYRDDGAWNILLGHHVLRTVFDKEDEQGAGKKPDIRGWLLEHNAQPDLWANGHAHFLQFIIYGGIPAVTSGSGSKLRLRNTCPGDDCQMEDAPLFSRSEPGYAVLDLNESQLVLRLKDERGETLYCWTRTHSRPDGEPCAFDINPQAIPARLELPAPTVAPANP